MVRKAGQCNRGGGRVQGRRSSDRVVDATDTQMMVPHSTESSDHIQSAAGLDSLGAAPATSSSRPVRRGRGKAKCKKLNDIVAVHGPMPIEIRDGYRAPVGDNASMFVSKVGEIVRCMCELHHDCWTVVPPEQKDKASEHIQRFFKLSYGRSEDVTTVNHKMSRAYSRIRSELYKKEYKIHFQGVDKNDVEAMAMAKAAVREKHPDDIHPDAWKPICDLFETDSWVKRSKRNKNNRTKLYTAHSAGTCSFVQVVYKNEQATGEPLKPIDLYRDTHTRKNGSFVNPVVEGLYNEMNELVNNEGEDNPMQEEIPEEERQMEIMTKVLGGRRSGHVKGMGCGVIPTPLSSSRMCSFTQSHNREYILTQQATQKKLEETEKKLEETEKKLEGTEKKLEGTEKKLEGTEKKLEETITGQAKLVDITKNLQATIDMMLSRFGGSSECSVTAGKST